MANLIFVEKNKLESFLEMTNGFVLNFSNHDLQQFIIGCVGVDLYNKKYDFSSGSKANRLRKLWEVESNQLVARLLEDLAKYWVTVVNPGRESDGCEQLHTTCLEIAARLKADSSVEDVDAIKPNQNDGDFEKLAHSIREDITRDQPDVAMDRLHTFLGKFFRSLCDKHGIEYDRSSPLNGIFGRYAKHLRDNKLVESEMTLRILKTCISLLEHFNDVRNNRSFAHPNKLLNYDESLFIFKHCTSMIKFVDALEIKLEFEANEKKSKLAIVRDISSYYADDLPF